MVSAAGYEYEVQASKGAKEQWEKLDMRVAYETDLVRGVVRKYTASDRTGIRSGVCIKLQYPLQKMVRSQGSFELAGLQHASPIDPAQLEQVPQDSFVNVAGIVHSVGLLLPGNGGALPKRTVVLANGECHMDVAFSGDLSSYDAAVGRSLLVMSVKKSAYQGVTRLETSRLSWILEDAPWLKIHKAEPDSPPKKALRSSTLHATTIANVLKMTAAQTDAVLIEASMVACDESLLDEALFASADSMRLPVTLRDQTASVPAVIWSSSFVGFLSKNLSELGDLYEGCGEDPAPFLAAVNENVNKQFRWVLRPRGYANGSLYWTVTDISAIEGQTA